MQEDGYKSKFCKSISLSLSGSAAVLCAEAADKQTFSISITDISDIGFLKD